MPFSMFRDEFYSGFTIDAFLGKVHVLWLSTRKGFIHTLLSDTKLIIFVYYNFGAWNF